MFGHGVDHENEEQRRILRGLGCSKLGDRGSFASYTKTQELG
jgi:hypothetical protein